MSWPVYKLKDITKEFISGGTPSTQVEEYWAGTIPWITGADVTDRIVSAGRKFITKEAVANSATHIVPKGSVLLVTRTGVGKIAKAGVDIAISQDLTGIALVDEADGDYVIAAIQHKIQSLQTIQQGSTIKGILRRDAENIDIPLPPLAVQRRIVEILDQADALRKLRREADELSERILPALFYRMFGDPVRNEKGFSRVRIADLVRSIERRDPANRPDEYFDYVDISGIDSVVGEIREAKKLRGADAPGRARQIMKANDVLVSTVRPYLRATAIVPESLDNQICSTGFCVLGSAKATGFGFLYALTRLPWFTEMLNGKSKGASYPAVSDKDILDLEVPYCEDDEIHRVFDKQVSTFRRQRAFRKQSNGNLTRMFQTLLRRTFTGKLKEGVANTGPTSDTGTLYQVERMIDKQEEGKEHNGK